MFHRKEVKVVLIHSLMLLASWPMVSDSLIITSVIAGDKKFKTISFDTKLLKPLTFEKELPNTEFRRHRTLRPPKFDIDVNIPIKLPLEEEYPKEEKKKPVTSNLFFQTDDIIEPSYGKTKRKYPKKTEYPEPQKKVTYKDEAYAASNVQPSVVIPQAQLSSARNPIVSYPIVMRRPVQQAQQAIYQPEAAAFQPIPRNARSDEREQPASAQPQPQQQQIQQEVMTQSASNQGYQSKNYGYQNQDYGPEFVPGGFINLQLSGPTGGPKMTYEDYDREKWAQQLSQTAGAMPYPILNYHQLQNFYGGLGTFTNGLAESRYVQTSLLDKLKSHFNHLTSKLHIG